MQATDLKKGVRAGDQNMSLMRRIKRGLEPSLPVPVHGLMMLAYRQMTYRTRVPLSWLYRLWRHGFITQNFVTYQLHENELKNYLSDFARWVKASSINGKYRIILDDKMLFHRLLSRFPEHVPPLHGVISRAGLLQLWDSGKHVPLLNWMQHQPVEGGAIVLKPICGSGGDGILIVRRVSHAYSVNGMQVDFHGLSDLVSSLCGYLVTGFVEQADYAARIYPNTTNTVRALTMWDSAIREPFIAIAVHRFGVERSRPVDNWSQGGLSSNVDLETGKLGPGVCCPNDGRLAWYEQHPDTASPVAGVMVPHWTQIKKRLLEIARSLPFLRYVGWDLVVTSTGFKILEGNNCSDVNLLQVHRPLLCDPRVRSFFAEHGVV